MKIKREIETVYLNKTSITAAILQVLNLNKDYSDYIQTFSENVSIRGENLNNE